MAWVMLLCLEVPLKFFAVHKYIYGCWYPCDYGIINVSQACIEFHLEVWLYGTPQFSMSPVQLNLRILCAQSFIACPPTSHGIHVITLTCLDGWDARMKIEGGDLPTKFLISCTFVIFSPFPFPFIIFFWGFVAALFLRLVPCTNPLVSVRESWRHGLISPNLTFVYC